MQEALLPIANSNTVLSLAEKGFLFSARPTAGTDTGSRTILSGDAANQGVSTAYAQSNGLDY